MPTTIDQSYQIIVSYLEQLIVEATGEEGRLCASSADRLNLHAVVLAGGEPHDIEIQPQSRSKLVAAVEHIPSVARWRKRWGQVEFSMKGRQGKMQVMPAT